MEVFRKLDIVFVYPWRRRWEVSAQVTEVVNGGRLVQSLLNPPLSFAQV
jgi:hypothetical protein